MLSSSFAARDDGPETNPDEPVDASDASGSNSTAHKDWCAHISWTLLLAGSALALALVVPNISLVFSILGGTTSSWLGFCVPGLLGLRLEADVGWTLAPARSPWRRLVAWILLVGGIAVGILTTYLTVNSLTS